MGKEKEIISYFCKRLHDIIEFLGIEKKELAALGEVSPATITKYLKGISHPSQDTLALWAFRKNINLNWLLLDEGEILRTPKQADAPTDETVALRRRVADMEKTIAAQEKLIAMYEEREGVPMPESTARSAPTTIPVSRSSQESNN